MATTIRYDGKLSPWTKHLHGVCWTARKIYAAARRSQMRLGLAYLFTGHERIFIDDVGSTSAKARSTDVVSIQTKAGMVFINDQF